MQVAMAALIVLAATAAVVSWDAQYVMVQSQAWLPDHRYVSRRAIDSSGFST